jgi:hypothetical protein
MSKTPTQVKLPTLNLSRKAEALVITPGLSYERASSVNGVLFIMPQLPD